MQAVRVEATVESDGSVKVTALPFRPGERVDVIVLPAIIQTPAEIEHSLRGSVLRYERPTDPVAEEDWEVLR